GDIGGTEPARQRCSGVIDDHLNGPRLICYGIDGALDSLRRLQIGGEDVGGDAICSGQFGGQGVQTRGITCHQQDVMATAGQLPRVFAAQTRTGAGYENSVSHGTSMTAPVALMAQWPV